MKHSTLNTSIWIIVWSLPFSWLGYYAAHQDTEAAELLAHEAQERTTALENRVTTLLNEANERQEANDALAATCDDYASRLGRCEQAAALCEDSLQSAGDELGHVRYYAKRLRYCKRDRDAAQCRLGGDIYCNAVDVPIGGLNKGEG